MQHTVHGSEYIYNVIGCIVLPGLPRDDPFTHAHTLQQHQRHKRAALTYNNNQINQTHSQQSLKRIISVRHTHGHRPTTAWLPIHQPHTWNGYRSRTYHCHTCLAGNRFHTKRAESYSGTIVVQYISTFFMLHSMTPSVLTSEM